MGLTQITTGGVDDNINIDSNTLKVDGTNNRVGIGTATAGRTLSVDGSIQVSNSTSGFGLGEGFEILHESSGSTYLLNRENAETRFYTNNSERMRIDSSGNIGFGTTSINNSYGTNVNIHTTTTNGARLKISDGTSGNGNVDGLDIIHQSGIAYIIQRESNDIRILTANAERMRIDSNGIIQSFVYNKWLRSDGTTSAGFVGRGSMVISGGADADFGISTAGGDLVFGSGGTTERMRINSSGQLLIGKTSGSYPLEVGGVSNPNIRCDGTSSSGQRGLIFAYNGTNFGSVGQNPQSGELTIRSGESGQNGYYITLETGATERMRIGSDGVVQINQSTGNAFRVQNSTSGEANMLFQNSATGTSIGNGLYVGIASNESSYMWAYHNEPMVWGTNNVERMRITNNGYLKASNNASYINSSGGAHELNQSGNQEVVQVRNTNSSFSSTASNIFAVRAATSSYWFIRGLSSSGSASADNEFYIRGDGNAFADGSWSGGGADYAEYFEWSDGNTEAEDRRGISVVLDGDKIRKAVTGEEPIGVISGNPSVVGDADMDRWKGKYLRDDYGSYVLDEDGYRQLNPDYDSDVEYVQREDRPEWDTVGLMGKLRIRKGQVTGTRWIKMRDVSSSVEEWLVR